MAPATRESTEPSCTMLVQFLVPLRDGQGQSFSAEVFTDMRAELTRKFGGVTAYLHSPAKGDWLDPSGQVERDEMMLVEVMTGNLDTHWWSAYRSRLERLFKQDRMLFRAMAVDVL